MVISKTRGFSINYYALTIAISSFLLFQVQPIIGKHILPMFGGTSAVWTTCLLFFQCMLLCGYLYAHFISGFQLKAQIYTHLFLVFSALIIMSALSGVWDTPITPGYGIVKHLFGSPVLQILTILTFGVGLPFFILSSTSTLIQSWFSRTYPHKSPYSLYALSNIASLLALLSYPMIFEPAIQLREQALLWFGLFIFFVLMITIAMVQTSKSVAGLSGLDLKEHNPENNTQTTPLDNLGPGLTFFWIGISACSSVMLMATTNKITLDIAPVPFLWVLPLSLYLLSFVMAFGNMLNRYQKLWVVMFIFALLIAWLNLKLEGSIDAFLTIGMHLFIIFFCCIFCHAALYLSRPSARHLTFFYLCIALGGALGGFFVNILAPVIFKDFWEYHLGLICCAGIGIVILFWLKSFKQYYIRLSAIIIISLITFLICVDLITSIGSSRGMIRNFYGVLQLNHSIIDNIRVNQLYNNSIMHGAQAMTEPFRYHPTTYFSSNSGVGLAFRYHSKHQSETRLNAGVIGLGIGTLASYGFKKDHFRFYEINQDVVRLASDSRWFTYLKDSKAKIDVILGDARLSLENELLENGSNQFDIFVIDAFSGDSIPIHLLTTQAFELYLAHLQKDGIIAVHISNRYIDFVPVFQALINKFDMEGVIIDATGNGYDSRWILLTRDKKFLSDLPVETSMVVLEKSKEFKPWTDGYSSIWKVLK